MDHNFQNLRAHILKMSTVDVWEAAKLEWVLDHVELIDLSETGEPETCPCGHFPIMELCWLRNTKNKSLTFVGNVCVRRFMGLPVDKVVDSLKRVLRDQEKALNPEASSFAHEQGWINDWEFKFCLDTSRRRQLSPKQLEKRSQINRKVLDSLQDRSRERRRDDHRPAR